MDQIHNPKYISISVAFSSVLGLLVLFQLLHFWVSYHKRRSCQMAKEVTLCDRTCTDLQRAIHL